MASQVLGRGFLVMLATAVVAGAAFYVLREHWSHALGLALYLLFLACPLMHLFMHRDHGQGHGANQTRQKKPDHSRRLSLMLFAASGSRRRQIVEDRAVGPLISAAMLREFAQRPQHRPHFFHSTLKIFDMRFRKPLDFARRPSVAPKRQKRAHFFQREAEVARSANELQHRHIGLAIVPIAVAASRRWFQQLNAFVIPDHLGGYAGPLCGLTNIHGPVFSREFSVLTLPLWEGAGCVARQTRSAGRRV